MKCGCWPHSRTSQFRNIATSNQQSWHSINCSNARALCTSGMWRSLWRMPPSSSRGPQLAEQGKALSAVGCAFRVVHVSQCLSLIFTLAIHLQGHLDQDP